MKDCSNATRNGVSVRLKLNSVVKALAGTDPHEHTQGKSDKSSYLDISLAVPAS